MSTIYLTMIAAPLIAGYSGGMTSTTSGDSMVPPELQGDLDYLLCKVSDVVRRRVDAGLAVLGLRASHHALLRVLRACGAISQQDIAHRLFVDPSTIVSLVDHLEKAGLVTRRRNPADRRVSLIELTADGEQRLAEAEVRAIGLRDKVFTTLPETEREQLRQLLLNVARTTI
jgi:DNA-binding MarR family transcriptional regulator